MLGALGHEHIERFHMNEGHSSLLTLGLLDEGARRAGRTAITRDDGEAVNLRGYVRLEFLGTAALNTAGLCN
jgi:starch phosphorylase